MRNPTDMGKNRTGISLAPLQGQQILSEADRIPPSSEGDERTLQNFRAHAIQNAEPIGTVPIPATLKGLAKAGTQKLLGRKPEVLVDKLGERLAFERSGTRLYDGLIGKCEALGPDGLEGTVELLKRFRDEEARHADLVRQAIESLGADPTAMTPCADASAVASEGIFKVIYDSRTSLSQCISALLTAEMTDHAGWEVLIQLCNEMGMKNLTDSFRAALAEETVHLDSIRRIHEELLRQEGGVAA